MRTATRLPARGLRFRVLGVVKFELARHGGADFKALNLRRIADAHGIHRRFGAVSERDDVAVGGKTLSDLVGNGQACIARPQQNFRRAQCAGGKHDDRRFDRDFGHRPALRPDDAGGDVPEPVRAFANDVDLEPREQLRAMTHGIRQVGERHGVLGAEVAARAAVAAAIACSLRHARRVDGVFEADGDARRHDGAAGLSRSAVEHLVFGHLPRTGIRRRAQPLLGAPEAFLDEPVLCHLTGPRVIGEHAPVGHEGDARIHERTAAKTAPNEDMHIAPETHVVERLLGSRAEARSGDLELVLEFGKFLRELARLDLAATLQHRNALARARQARSRDAAAITGAHDDHVIPAFQRAERRSQP